MEPVDSMGQGGRFGIGWEGDGQLVSYRRGEGKGGIQSKFVRDTSRPGGGGRYPEQICHRYLRGLEGRGVRVRFRFFWVSRANLSEVSQPFTLRQLLGLETSKK